MSYLSYLTCGPHGLPTIQPKQGRENKEGTSTVRKHCNEQTTSGGRDSFKRKVRKVACCNEHCARAKAASSGDGQGNQSWRGRQHIHSL